ASIIDKTARAVIILRNISIPFIRFVKIELPLTKAPPPRDPFLIRDHYDVRVTFGGETLSVNYFSTYS
ncbi:MAG: hypothetical protein IJT09_00995, partial [Abditibacteriota bacterium]|nr:hypothetical protein [Abditibacteriota bacterium]